MVKITVGGGGGGGRGRERRGVGERGGGKREIWWGEGERPTMFDEQLLDCVAKDIHRLAGERGRVSQVRMHLNT